jgi:S1-C subfamily serine protease
VEPASFAEDVDFARGDVITEMNHVPVTSLADYRTQLAKLKPGDDILFKVARHGDNDRVLNLFLAGTVPPR